MPAAIPVTNRNDSGCLPAASGFAASCLERRVRRKIGWSTAGMPPERLLAAGFPSFTISAQSVVSLEPAGNGDVHPHWVGGDPLQSAESLSFRARSNWPNMRAGSLEMGLAGSRRHCDRAVQFGPGRDQRDGRVHRGHVPRGVPSPGSSWRLKNSISSWSSSAAWPQRLKETAGASDGEPGARERIGRQVRELERQQRIRGEWQEKLLALRLEKLLGRAVKIVETAVLLLVLSGRPDRGRRFL